MKSALVGKRAESVVDGAPTGVIRSADSWVKSMPMLLREGSTPVVVRGRVDVLVARDDGTVAVVDFKTGPTDPVARYGPQLAAYAHALEHPATGGSLTVTATGLLIFSPGGFEAAGERAALVGGLHWVDMPRNRAAFEAFLAEVVTMLDRPEPPPPSPGCSWCSDEARSFPLA
jgi:hypothetical protein